MTRHIKIPEYYIEFAGKHDAVMDIIPCLSQFWSTFQNPIYISKSESNQNIFGDDTDIDRF